MLQVTGGHTHFSLLLAKTAFINFFVSLSMDIQTSKIELAKLILNLENPTVLKKIKDLITGQQEDFGNALTIAEKEEIEIALSQLNEGKRTSFDSFLVKVS